jgi:hypothetical protein
MKLSDEARARMRALAAERAKLPWSFHANRDAGMLFVTMKVKEHHVKINMAIDLAAGAIVFSEHGKRTQFPLSVFGVFMSAVRAHADSEIRAKRRKKGI